MSRLAKLGASSALLVLLSLSHAAQAAPTPASGTLSPTTPTVSFTGGFLLSDPSGAGACVPGTCDEYALTVMIPADYAAAHPNAYVAVSLAFDDIDYDLYVLNEDFSAKTDSAGSDNPEATQFNAGGAGTKLYYVDVVGYTSSGGTYTTTITLNEGAPPDSDHDGVADPSDACPGTPPNTAVDATGCPAPDSDGDGIADSLDACPGTPAGTTVKPDGCPIPTDGGLAPRYQVHVAPTELGNDAGEPSIGYNKFSKRSMFISYTQALRQTYQEDVVPQVLPASCEATWEDKSGLLTTLNSLDPILFTDEATGRTWNSQLSGDNSLMEFTDNDGETWTPAQVGPPNGGADHQAVASGPYPAGALALGTWPDTTNPRAVYYCSQSVAAAFCSRSDNGGLTFGPGYPFKNLECAAGALHGHVKVAPDGTVYVPDSSQCVLPLGGTAEHVVAFTSTDAGQTWDARDIPFSTGGDGSDPSIGIATDGTVYMCYTNADSTVHMAWSSDQGQTWDGGVDLGAALGLVQTRFPQAIAGDPDRAACAFLATTTPGNGSDLSFEGVWHGYVATTYDHGNTWHLVNVTPGDPVQGWGGIGPDGTNRNLLDFNDLQIDDLGRTYFAFADGCTGACVKDPSKNAFAAKATIVRQTGGRTLYAKYDDVTAGTGVARFNKTTPIKPEPACARADLSKRTRSGSTVMWNAPDTGGSAITNYTVYRATAAAGPFTVVGNSPTKSFVDATALETVEKYYYRIEAQNTVGIADVSNVIELPITADPINTCLVPGELIIKDTVGDADPAGDDFDIAWVGVAEPGDRPDDFVITMKITAFTAGVPPPTTFYTILFPLYGSKYIALDSANGPATFVYGTYSELPQGLLAFTQVGTLTGSSYAADGTISFVVPRSFFGSPIVGADIVGFDARVRAGSSTAPSRDTAGPSSYTVRGIGACASDVFSLANLVASRLKGAAPLPVTFTVGGVPSAGSSLASYSILFGDEPGASPAPTTGSFAGGATLQLVHTYATPGTYRARLTVTDSAGKTSSNLAEQTIVVGAAAVDGANGSSRLGGALSLPALALLGLAGLARRRQIRSPR